MLHHHTPVRPNVDPPSAPGGGAGAEPSPPDDGGEETVDFQHVLHGQEKAQPSRHEPVPVKSPHAMTAAEKEKHDLTHMPPHPGCSICRSTRTPNLGHTASHEHERKIPLLVGDYCFLKSFAEKCLATCLVLSLYPYKKSCRVSYP